MSEFKGYRMPGEPDPRSLVETNPALGWIAIVSLVILAAVNIVAFILVA